MKCVSHFFLSWFIGLWLGRAFIEQPDDNFKRDW